MNDTATPNKLTRRMLLLGGAAVVVGGSLGASQWFNVFAEAATPGALSVADAHAQARSGDIYLVDIRRPDEWVKTGVAEYAKPIDMRRDDFETTLQAIFTEFGEKPVALICARGVRSNRMNQRLAAAGFANILDVPEGMLGSGAGPGYIARALPLRAPTKAEMNGQIL